MTSAGPPADDDGIHIDAMDLSEDPYRVLKLRRTATEEDIKVNRKQLELRYHPDKNRDASEAHQQLCRERLDAVRAAYALVGTPEPRAEFDATWQAAHPSSEATWVAVDGFEPDDGDEDSLGWLCLIAAGLLLVMTHRLLMSAAPFDEPELLWVLHAFCLLCCTGVAATECTHETPLVPLLNEIPGLSSMAAPRACSFTAAFYFIACYPLNHHGIPEDHGVAFFCVSASVFWPIITPLFAVFPPTWYLFQLATSSTGDFETPSALETLWP